MTRKMKNSGVEWIGMIPDGWCVGRVKSSFTRKDSKAQQDNPVILSLARSGVKVRDMSNNEGQIAESYYNYNLVEPGDLLLNPMDLYSGANCSISKVSGVISPAYINLRANEGVNPVFYDYYFKTQYWAMAMFAHGKGVSYENRWTMGMDTLNNYFIPVPSYQEQNRIADFLDAKCAAIDDVIAKTNESIEEYKKLKQAVITEAVTKGVRGNRPMKSACSDWFTEIPNEWQVRKVLSFLDMRVIDGPHESPELHEQGIPYVSATAIENGKICFDKMRGFISPEYCDICDKRYVPKRNDILMIKLGASTGQVAIVDTDRRFNIWVPLAAIRCNASASYKYMYYCFQSTNLIRQMELSWTFGTQQTLGVKTIEQLKVTFPPLDEQREIADYLDSKCAAIDTLISKKQQFIDELTAYKKSLIYEYVTGKKEVPA